MHRVRECRGNIRFTNWPLHIGITNYLCISAATYYAHALQVRSVTRLYLFNTEACSDGDSADLAMVLGFHVDGNLFFDGFLLQTFVADIGERYIKGIFAFNQINFITCRSFFDYQFSGFHLINKLYFQLCQRRCVFVRVLIRAEHNGVCIFRLLVCRVAVICNIRCRIINFRSAIIGARLAFRCGLSIQVLRTTVINGFARSIALNRFVIFKNSPGCIIQVRA